MGRESHPLLSGGRSETSFSHGFSADQIQSLAAMCETLVPPLSPDSIGDGIPRNEAVCSFFRASGSRHPIPEEQQLHDLLETLSATKPHYIRCVKPNNLLKPAIFENKNVQQQLRCGGVVEANRISNDGYPTRRPFVEFVDRYGILAPEFLDHSSDEVTICKRLLEKVGLNGFQISKTKVFLRAGQMEKLDARRTEVLGRLASIIQRKTRSYLARRRFVLLRKSTMLIQSACRARQAHESMRREAACLRIQKDLHMHIARKAYKHSYSSAICVKIGLRGMAAPCKLCLRKQIKAVIFIQSHCRKYLARVQYLGAKKAAITIQCAWRGRAARKELQKLKMAARETGALQAAKNKLEKQVKKLTWRLQWEKRMRADLEESNNQEIVRLQSALNDVQLQFKETKELLLKEQEAAKRAAEMVPHKQKTPVIDHTVMEKLTSENKKLKGVVKSLRKKYEETKRVSKKRLKQALEAESKIINMKTDMQRLVEKISDMESDNQLLRQQILVNSPVKKLSENSPTTLSQEPESAAPVEKYGTESDGKFRRSHIEYQQENIDALINCVMKNIGLSHGKPIAALIYESLLHWKSFEAERNPVFDQLIQTVGSAVEGFRSSHASANLAAAAAAATVRLVEAKYPALPFKQQLTAFVEKIYGVIRDKLKKHLGSLLSLCIQKAVKLKANGTGKLIGRLFACTAERIPPSELIGTTGTSDSFIRAILYALCIKMSPEKMLPFAATVAAAGCKELGARTGPPIWMDPCLAPIFRTIQLFSEIKQRKSSV